MYVCTYAVALLCLEFGDLLSSCHCAKITHLTRALVDENVHTTTWLRYCVLIRTCLPLDVPRTASMLGLKCLSVYDDLSVVPPAQTGW